jgi:fused signal recognition particle receptor
VFSFFKSKPKPAPEIPAPAAEIPAPAPAAQAPAPAEASPADLAPAPRLSWAQRLKSGLAKTRDRLGGQLAGLFGVGRKIDAALYEELEAILLTADVGVDATEHLLDLLQKRVRRDGLTEASQLQTALKEALVELLMPLQAPLDVTGHKPFILMLAGVNGAGKTTTIGKLAKLYQSQGLSVLLAAGDTFRAAAREQLQVWGERNNVTVVSQDKGDSAAVIFDAIQAARARGIDVVLADTAGRLPTQLHLMEEIRKVKRVIEKTAPGAPHEVLLVLDANTGQNAVTQVKAFDDALGVTGLALTKLDGTAKGGAIAAIAQARPIPVRYIGVGETLDDLRPFDARDFVEAVFSA